MKKQIFLALLMSIAFFSVGVISASEINVNDTYIAQDSSESLLSVDEGSVESDSNILSINNVDTDLYENSIGENELSKKPVEIKAPDIDLYYKNGTRFIAELSDENGNYLANQSLIFTISGIDYERITDSQGQASVAINLIPGDYDFIVSYSGNENYLTSKKTATCTVYPTIGGDDIVKYYRNGTQFYATFLNGDGTPLANTDVNFNINGVFYTRPTNASGVARLNINLPPENYILTAIHPDTGYTYSNNVSVLPTIVGNDLVKVYKDENQYYAKFLNGEGTPLANVNVSFNINGVFYHRTTNNDGVAALNINLPVGEYILTACNPEDTYALSNIVTVLSVVVNDIEVDSNMSDYVSYIDDDILTDVDEIDSDANPFGLPDKKVFIDADGGSDAMKWKLANALKDAGWEVLVGDTYSNAHYEDYYNVPENYVLVNIYNGFCAGTIRELASARIQNLLNSKNVVCVPVFETADWTNPQGMAPYRYGDFSGYSAGRAWDDYFSSDDPSISDVDQFLYSNNIKYCASPTVEGIMYQFMHGGYFNSVGR